MVSQFGGRDEIPVEIDMIGATFTIAPFQGATFCIDALRGLSGFARSFAVTNYDLS